MSQPRRTATYGIDTKTRYQGVFARHKIGCAVERGERCRCQPGYFGVAYDGATSRQIKTTRLATAEAARNARADLLAKIQRGETTVTGGLRLTEARTQFVAAAREGKALNKQGRRYKPRAIDDIDEALRVHVEPALGTKRLTTMRRGDIQRIVDELAPRLSGSRVRSVVNALRSLYRWAQDRDLANHDPAALVRLPAMNATPIERVASPVEFAQLLSVLPLEMALPYALAGYGMGRRVQIVHLDWADVDLELEALEWGATIEARKYDASQRVVPVVAPLAILLRQRFLEMGRPARGLVCPPLTSWASSGLLNTGWLAKRAQEKWDRERLTRITLQEARHSAGTWLDAAGVSPKVASVLMGHATPERQAGAATITLARYTHALPEDIERARGQLTSYLAGKGQSAKARPGT